MATITHHIHRLREQPSHVRERIALGVSGGVTGLVAIGWLVAMSSSGAFSLTAQTVAQGVAPSNEVQQAFTESGKGINGLLGAAGAAFGAPTTTDAQVNVVDVRSSSTLDATASSASATVIPF